MYPLYSQPFKRLTLYALIAGFTIFGPSIILAQEVVTYTSSVKSIQRPDSQSQFRSQTEGALFGFVLFGQTNNVPGNLTAPNIPAFWSGIQVHSFDFVGTYPALFGSSYDPFKTFDGPNGFAAGIAGLAPRPDDLVRKDSAVPNPVWIGLAPNTDPTTRGNHLEASMIARFVLRGSSRYPVTITFPAYVSVQDEEYFLGPHFGYICSGINVRVPLSFIPRRYGRWSAGSSVDFCYYGTTTSEFVKSIGLQIPKIAAALSVEL